MKNNFITLASFVCASLLCDAATAQVTCNPDFSYAQTGSNYLTYAFTNTTVASSSSYQSYTLYLLNNNLYLTSLASIGGNGSTAQHTFSGPGIYKVVLAMDDSSALGYCHAYDTQTVVINNPIQGTIIALHDSINNPATYTYPNLSFKVWLIQYNAATNMLSAVDSQIVNGTNTYMVPYAFHNKPDGSYLVKAKDMLGLTYNSTYMVPTYHMDDIYWYNASTINHSNLVGPFYNRNVMMMGGAQTTGPGFIGGDVTQGANRPAGAGTLAIGDPVSNMDIYLKDDATGSIVGYTTTDMQGHYAFANLPLGTYTVFPDALNFETIADEHITLGNTNPSSNTRDFTQTATKVKPNSPTAINKVNVELVGVYPNPVTDKLNINWKKQVKEVTVKMYTIIGEEVYSATKPVTTIDLHHLAKGVYVLKITEGDAVQTLRIGKQ
ncbi:hypothetical protein DBR32_05595 [Taibaiella sp. KBW10]|uniref:T9SS type A sorting domain-containing protein n=1 Tax=Taibaiella sp. KBW10 TaxID=2153357 RepID=UPI000F5B20A4|nr:T9SS type A sorting domain-containing protein [Taibaiella sp. KBW10]RQO31435.1 hypothetical protein DBR32_05595 [Taibaiella sp. KBW10]